MAGCFSPAPKRQAVADRIAFATACAAPAFETKTLPPPVRFAVKRMQKEGATDENFTQLIASVSKSGAMAARLRTELLQYAVLERNDYQSRLISAVTHFFSDTTQESIDMNLYTFSDRQKVLSALLALYLANPQEQRIHDWTSRLDAQTRLKAEALFAKAEDEQINAFTRQVIEAAEYTEKEDVYSADLLETLQLQCMNMGWYFALPGTAQLLLDALPENERRGAAQNYQRLLPELEKMRFQTRPAFDAACVRALTETKRYFTNKQLEKFSAYLEQAVLPLAMNPEQVVLLFCASEIPPGNVSPEVYERVNKFIKKMYHEDQAGFGTNVVILYKLTLEFKASAEQISHVGQLE